MSCSVKGAGSISSLHKSKKAGAAALKVFVRRYAVAALLAAVGIAAYCYAPDDTANEVCDVSLARFPPRAQSAADYNAACLYN